MKSFEKLRPKGGIQTSISSTSNDMEGGGGDCNTPYLYPFSQGQGNDILTKKLEYGITRYPIRFRDFL